VKIIMILIFANGMSMDVEFDSMQNCEKARDMVTQSLRENYAPPTSTPVVFECVKK
jgi:hypothetical protein